MKIIDLSDSTEFWNLDENKGYKKIKANDGIEYKVWVGDPNESFQKKWWYNNTDTQQIANILANVRKDITTLLKYIESNPQLWSQHPIAFGIYHTFDLHLYKNFEYLETRPNEFGILGLNKPKEIKEIKAEIDNATINYELGTKRNIMLTIRHQNTGNLREYKEVIDLAIHEVTHTTCNDVRWVDEKKGGNHREPYPSYHRMMRRWARECGIIN